MLRASPGDCSSKSLGRPGFPRNPDPEGYPLPSKAGWSQTPPGVRSRKRPRGPGVTQGQPRSKPHERNQVEKHGLPQTATPGSGGAVIRKEASCQSVFMGRLLRAEAPGWAGPEEADEPLHILPSHLISQNIPKWPVTSVFSLLKAFQHWTPFSIFLTAWTCVKLLFCFSKKEARGR